MALVKVLARKTTRGTFSKLLETSKPWSFGHILAIFRPTSCSVEPYKGAIIIRGSGFLARMNLASQVTNAAYLIIRGMKTLHLRVQQQNSTALKMAKILEAHPKVSHTYYPGLPSHPEHQLAKRQMTGFGGVVSFEIDGDLMRTIKFVDALKIPYIAPSFGGCESIVDQPAIMSYWDLSQSDRIKYGMKDNLVRFSFGLEDFEDLKADILQALETI